MEKKGGFIRVLIERVRSAAYEDMDEVVAFVDWLDGELSTLVGLQDPPFIPFWTFKKESKKETKL